MRTSSLTKTRQLTSFAFVLFVVMTVYCCFTTSSWSNEAGHVIQGQLTKAKKSDLEALYRLFNYTPLWLQNGVPTDKAKKLMDVIRNAEVEGLNPNDYRQAFNAFVKLDPADPKQIAEADMRFTESVMRFIDHLRNGRFFPQSLAAHNTAFPIKTNPSEVIATILQHDKNGEIIQNLGPDFPLYSQLRSSLAQYRELAKQYPEMPKMTTSHPLKKGTHSPEVVSLRKILSIYGDLLTDEPANDAMLFTDAVEQAVKNFQARHTLAPTGIIDKSTRAALNMPLNDRIQRLIINMERLRWYPDQLGHKYLFVNIAGYETMAFEDQHFKFSIPIIVGHPTRRTPLFNARLASFVLNPSWGVPISIMLQDKLPRILEDPEYLSTRGYTVTDTAGRVVDPNDIDWESDALNYRLRQKPGPNNALGEIRFTLDDYLHPGRGTNHYSIFMHSTPEKNLFKNAHRGFSSGCIRLQDPEKLAKWTLENRPEWTIQKIEAEIAKKRTETIKLTNEEAIPVYFLYATAWTDPKGIVHFGDDLYKEDANLIRQMRL